MKMLGIEYLLVSNAAGNLNRKWKKGELMLIDDHIILQPDNPLRGENFGSPAGGTGPGESRLSADLGPAPPLSHDLSGMPIH
jgi:purine nucleoside phosphorylase